MYDSIIVLSWLTGNPHRFQTLVEKRVSFILEQISPDRWKHVPGIMKYLSRRYPLEGHCLWWNGPQLDPSLWPEKPATLSGTLPAEEKLKM